MANGEFTRAEILQQPDLWPDTVRRVGEAALAGIAGPVLTGAGTSAYAALAVEAAWNGARAVPSTELLLDFCRYLPPHEAVVSFARSGDSPESVAVVEKIQRARPGVRHVAVTCNADGKLASWPGVEAVVLDPRTNDRSLAMTSSFSNLVMAGLALARPREALAALPGLCTGWERRLETHERKARALAAQGPRRMVALGSTALFGAAREACLKVLEMTAGRIATLAETYLGLRHGPMSFLEPETLVLCFVSSDGALRRYELDVVRELKAKRIGRTVALGDPGEDAALFDEAAPTGASSLPDCLRTPAEIVFAQLLAYHLSQGLGLDPDNPSPGGVINRVVEGVRIYD